MQASGSDPRWVKSSHSYATGNCIEVAHRPSGPVLVRDSTDADGAVLRLTPGDWQAFLGGVRNGEFDGFGQ